MKEYRSYIYVGVGMFLLGVLLSTLFYYRSRGESERQVQTDTVLVHDTVRYSKEEIKTEVDASKSSRVEYVYVKLPPEVIREIVHDTTYIEKEVPLRKEHYYSEADDVRIWHSGVSSQIDSIENVRETKIVTNKYVKDICHSFGIYANMGYAKGFSAPIGVRYTYHPKRWLGIGVKAEHDLVQNRVSVMGTLEFSLGI